MCSRTLLGKGRTQQQGEHIAIHFSGGRFTKPKSNTHTSYSIVFYRNFCLGSSKYAKLSIQAPDFSMTLIWILKQ